jgi:serpin B
MTRRTAMCLALVVTLVVACSAPGVSSTADPSAIRTASPSVVASSTVPANRSPSPDPAGITLAKADVPRSDASDVDAASAATSINGFGLDLYRRLAGPDGNIVISPASVAIALSMARAGARGETGAQMDTVLHAAGLDDLVRGMNALDQALAARNETVTVGEDEFEIALRVANGQFAQDDLTFEPAFLEALAAAFGAGVQLVDYRTDAEAARALINTWVSERTEERIPELLGAGTITSSTRLTLVNAIYLKAAWLFPFHGDLTQPGPFTRADGSTVDVPTMASNWKLMYADGNDWRAVELPYAGGGLSMTVILPDDLAALEQGLDAEWFARLGSKLEERDVSLWMPRFGIETMADLQDHLAALGMPLAFSSAADFSGITDQERLSIESVVHQANIDVDEEGTEAAAATAVVMPSSGSPGGPVELRLDRPFLFALRDVPTGAILFLGRVADPSDPS